MITLYPDQNKFIAQIRKKISEKHKHIICQAPTGFGKTVCFSYIAHHALTKGNRVLIITDRTELLTETGGTLQEFGMKPVFIEAGTMYPPRPYDRLVVGMAQTMRRRIDTVKHGKAWRDWFASFDVVIIDECHKQEFNDFFCLEKDGANVAESLFNGAIVLGFTATPQRTGNMRQLGEDYTTMVLGPTTDELIKMGRLMPDRYYSIKGADLDGIKMNSKGDFDEGAAYERFKRPELFAGVVDNWLKLTPNTCTIVFCVNIQHCIDTAEEFNKRGIKAKFVTSEVARPKIPEHPTEANLARYEKHLGEFERYQAAFKLYSGDRIEVINEWKEWGFYVLINAGILTTGFNHKPIQTVIINRVTISDNLWLQMIGRGSRPSKETDKQLFNILDFGNHGVRLGKYRERREYSLIHKTSKGGGVAPIKECGDQKRPGVKANPETGYTPDKSGRPGCGCFIAASVMICPFCGYTYDTEKELIAAELVLMDYDILPQNNVHIKEPDKWREIESQAASRGYKDGWVVANILARHGVDELINYAQAKGHQSGWVYRMQKRYGGKVTAIIK
jgi:superfamily II DNA or RNA helicase